MQREIKKLIIEASEQEIYALAQFLKRVGWDDIRKNSATETEAHEAQTGIERMSVALAEIGYNPR